MGTDHKKMINYDVESDRQSVCIERALLNKISDDLTKRPITHIMFRMLCVGLIQGVEKLLPDWIVEKFFLDIS